MTERVGRSIEVEGKICQWPKRDVSQSLRSMINDVQRFSVFVARMILGGTVPPMHTVVLPISSTCPLCKCEADIEPPRACCWRSKPHDRTLIQGSATGAEERAARRISLTRCGRADDPVATPSEPRMRARSEATHQQACPSMAVHEMG